MTKKPFAKYGLSMPAARVAQVCVCALLLAYLFTAALRQGKSAALKDAWADASMGISAGTDAGEADDPQVMYSFQYTFVDGEFVLTNRYDYNRDGSLAAALAWNDDGSAGNYSKSSYDAFGRQLEWAEYSGDGSLISRQQWDYDASGSLLSWSSADGDGAVTERVSYEYDEVGNLLAGTHYGGSGEADSWQECVYDDYGNLVKDTSYCKFAIIFCDLL